MRPLYLFFTIILLNFGCSNSEQKQNQAEVDNKAVQEKPYKNEYANGAPPKGICKHQNFVLLATGSHAHFS